MAPLVIIVNLTLLLLYPAAWFAPVAYAGWLPFFSGHEVTIYSGIRDLWHSDQVLALLVLVFAVVIPYSKTIALALVHFRLVATKPLPMIEALSKLAMADVFLIALYIVLVKGVGVGHIASAWGLWLFTGCVLASFWAGFETRRKIKNGG